jgi:hypothetical protein
MNRHTNVKFLQCMTALLLSYTVPAMNGAELAVSANKRYLLKDG